MDTLISICPICNQPFDNWLNADGTPHKLCCSARCGHISAGLKRSAAARASYICPICDKEFISTIRRNRVYCSHQCKNEAQRRTGKMVKCKCAFCGKPFTAQDGSSWATHSQQRFCSQTCKGNGIAQERGLRVRKKTAFVCECCGEEFTRIARPERNYRFCSRSCYWAFCRGENHWLWQGGTDRYYGPNWDEQREAALERDGYTCQTCGAKEDRMNVHHIILRSEFDQDWESMNDLSNLVTLCHPCHARLHMEQRGS